MRSENLRGTIKLTNVGIMGVSEGEEKEKRAQRLVEAIIARSHPSKFGEKYEYKHPKSLMDFRKAELKV